MTSQCIPNKCTSLSVMNSTDPKYNGRYELSKRIPPQWAVGMPIYEQYNTNNFKENYIYWNTHKNAWYIGDCKCYSLDFTYLFSGKFL